MKNILVLLFLVVGSAVANEEGGEKSARICPPVVGDIHLSIFHKIPKLMQSCVFSLLGPDNILKGNDTSIEPIQNYFTEMCDNRVTTFIECMSDQAANLEVCEDSTIMRKLFVIMGELFLNIIDSGCAESASRFVTLIQGLKSIPETGANYEDIKKCGEKRFAIIYEILGSDSEIMPSKLYVLHKELSKLFDCFKMLECEPPMREVMEYFINKVTNNLKCVHPLDGTLVPCTSISSDSVTACCICGIKSHNSNMEMYDILEMDSEKCFKDLMTFDIKTENTTIVDKMIRRDIKAQCESNRAAEMCLKPSMLISEECLNGTLKTEFKLWIDSIRNGIEDACLEDGTRVADFTFELYRIEKSEQSNVVWDCVQVAKSTRNVIDEHKSSSKNMRFYHEMETIKECLVNKLQGHQTSIDAVTSLMDILLKKVTCVHPEDGSTVLCETLMEHNHQLH